MDQPGFACRLYGMAALTTAIWLGIGSAFSALAQDTGDSAPRAIAASVNLANLSQTYDGQPKSATVTTVPDGLPVRVRYDDSPVPPTRAGTYRVVATIVDPAHAGTATGDLVIRKADALVMLTHLTQPYGGSPRTVVATTLPANLKVLVRYSGNAGGPVLPGKYPVSATIDDPNYAGGALDLLTITVTALVRHAPQISGGVDGTVWTLSGDDVVLAGKAWISGDLLVAGTPVLRLDALPMIAGSLDDVGASAPSDYSVTLGGTSIIRYLVRRIDPVLLAAVPPPVTTQATREVTLNLPSDIPGNFASIRNLTLNGTAGAWALPPGAYDVVTVNDGGVLVLGEPGARMADVYNLQTLTFGSGSRVKLAGPVLLVLANGITIRNSLGDEKHPEWLTIAVAAGGVTLAPEADFAGYVVAPNGGVTIGRGATLVGEITSDTLTVGTDGILAEPK